jgi:hypothetical protein
MNNPGMIKGSIYEFGYFDTHEEAAYWLELFAHEKNPLSFQTLRSCRM